MQSATPAKIQICHLTRKLGNLPWRQSVSVAALVMLSFTACDESETTRTATTSRPGPLTAAEVSERTALLVGDVAEDIGTTAESLADTATWSRFTDLIDQVMRLTMGPADEPIDPGTEVPPRPPVPETPDASDDEIPGDEAYGAAEWAAEIRTWLDENVFTDEQLETSTGDAATFLIRGETVCEPVMVCDDAGWIPGDGEVPEVPTDPEMPPEPDATERPTEPSREGCAEEVDTECVELVNALEIRVGVRFGVEDDPESMTSVAIFIGPDQFQPITVELNPTQLDVEADLGEVAASYRLALELAEDLGHDVSSAFTLERLDGRIGASFDVSGEQAFTVSASVFEAIVLALNTEEGSIRGSVAPANPLASVQADGIARLASFIVDLNRVDVSLPFGMLGDGSSLDGFLSISLGGFSFAFDLDDVVDTLTVTNLGFGETTTSVNYDSTEIFSFDLNADAGRTVDVSIEPREAINNIAVSFVPELDVTVGFGLAAIADSFGDPESGPPAWMLDDVLTFALTGETAPTIMPIEGNGAGFDGGVKVLSGRLVIGAEHADAPLVVNEGECLVGLGSDAARSDESHELLMLLDAVACP